MKLLVDDRWFGPTGIGRFASEIIQRVPPGNTVDYLSKTWAIKNPLSPLLLGIAVNRKAPDLFWSPGFMPPMNCKIPYIVTMHDLIHIKYGSKHQIFYYNNVIRPLLRKSACVLTVSEYSRGAILDWSQLPHNKVITVYNGISKGYTTVGPKFDPGYNYILYVGNKRQNKNLKRLLNAYANSRLPDDIKLVLTGEATSELSELISYLNISSRTVFLGYVPEKDLPSVYRGATALILVALHEGFGIPIIEAMACGTPVLAANSGALPEISENATLLVDPYNLDEISFGIEKIVNDSSLRKELVSSGLKRARKFSWDTTASRAWKIFISAVQ